MIKLHQIIVIKLIFQKVIYGVRRIRHSLEDLPTLADVQPRVLLSSFPLRSVKMVIYNTGSKFSKMILLLC